MNEGIDALGAGALVAAAGELPPTAMIMELAARHSIVVAADGAAATLFAQGIRPDVVIGDLDSLGTARAALDAAGVRIIERPSQEENDLEKALQWVVDAGHRSATVIGAGGGMIDHTLNNFSILSRFSALLQLRIRDELSVGYLVRDALRLTTAPGARISLIPLPQARITTSGLEWELENAMLAIGVREGASNRATKADVSVLVSEGTVLVVHFPAAS